MEKQRYCTSFKILLELKDKQNQTTKVIIPISPRAAFSASKQRKLKEMGVYLKPYTFKHRNGEIVILRVDNRSWW